MNVLCTGDSGSGTVCNSPDTNRFSVTKVTLPAAAGSLEYSFVHGASFGELSQMTMPYGAIAKYEYSLDTTQPSPTVLWTELMHNHVTKRTLEYKKEPTTGNIEEVSTFGLLFDNQPGFKCTGSSLHTAADGSTLKSYFYPICYPTSGGPDEWKAGLIYRTDNPDGTKTERQWVQNPPPAGGMLWHYNNAYVRYEASSHVGHTCPGTLGANCGFTRSFTQDMNGNVTQSALNNWATESQITAIRLTPEPKEPNGMAGTLLRTSMTAFRNAAVAYTDDWSPGTRPARLNQPLSHEEGGVLNTARQEFCYDENDNPKGVAKLKATYSTSLVNCTSMTAIPAALLERTTYAVNGNLLSTKDGRSNETTFSYDTNELYVTGKQLKNSSGGVLRSFSLTHDSSSGLLKQTDDLDNLVTSAKDYDAFGRLKAASESAGGLTLQQTSKVYSDTGRYVKTTTSLDATRSVVSIDHFDQLGRPWLSRLSETGAITPDDLTQGIKTEYRYLATAAAGRVEFLSNPYRTTSDGTMGWTRRSFDGGGRLKEEAHFSSAAVPSPWPGGNEAGLTGKKKVQYTAFATQSCDEAASETVPPTGNPGSCRTVHRDAGGRIVKVLEDSKSLEPPETVYVWDSLDNLREVQQGLRTRTFQYDPLGRLTSAANPESGTTQYRYDDASNLIERRDGRNVVTCYGVLDEGSCDGSGYNALNQPTLKSYWNGTTQQRLANTPDVVYGYGEDLRRNGDTADNYVVGRLTSIRNGISDVLYNRLDGLGRVAVHTQRMGSSDYVFSYAYNRLSQPTQVTYPRVAVGTAAAQDPGRVVATGYDNAGRISGVTSGGGFSATVETGTHPAGGSTVEGYGPHGAMQRVRYDNGLVEATGYNPRLQMTSLHAAKLDGSVYSDRLRLSFDFGTTANNGNVLGQTMISGGETWTQSYTFDKFNRLKTAGEAAVSPGSGWSQSFGYDRYGNRGLLSGLADGTETLTVALESQIEGLHPNNRDSRATVDGAGNVIAFSTTSATFEFDGENRMTRSAKPVLPSGEQVVVYEYGGEGQRVRKTVSPGAGQETTVNVYEASGELAQEYGGSGDGGRRYLTVDHLGSTRLTTDGAGAVAKRYDYTPFGRQLFMGDNGRDASFPGAEPQSVDPMKVRFTGQQRDTETGLDFFGARYMSAAQGRFTSPDDPLVYSDPSSPQSWNLYSYGLNNPLLYSDPDGHEPCVNGVNPENGNICTVATAEKPKVDTTSSPIGPLLIDVLVTSVQVAQKTQELVQPVADWFSRPRNPTCTAGYTALGASVGFWAGGGLGSLGLAGGPAAAATIPGGAAGGTAFGGAIGGFGGLVLCSTGTGSGGGGNVAGGSGGRDFWSGLKPFRGKTKTNGQQGKNKRFYEWDHTHGDVEVYDGRGRHLGSANPTTGEMTKPAVPGRSITI